VKDPDQRPKCARSEVRLTSPWGFPETTTPGKRDEAYLLRRLPASTRRCRRIPGRLPFPGPGASPSVLWELFRRGVFVLDGACKAAGLGQAEQRRRDHGAEGYEGSSRRYLTTGR